jgi:hypothetical protein
MILNFCFSSVVGKPFAITILRSLFLRILKVDLNRRNHYVVRKESNMLWTICVILFILWLLGFLGGYTGGGLIHILLVVAIIVVVIQVIQGRR